MMRAMTSSLPPLAIGEVLWRSGDSAQQPVYLVYNGRDLQVIRSRYRTLDLLGPAFGAPLQNLLWESDLAALERIDGAIALQDQRAQRVERRVLRSDEWLLRPNNGMTISCRSWGSRFWVDLLNGKLSPTPAAWANARLRFVARAYNRLTVLTDQMIYSLHSENERLAREKILLGQPLRSGLAIPLEQITEVGSDIQWYRSHLTARVADRTERFPLAHAEEAATLLRLIETGADTPTTEGE